ncbi:MAG: cell division protein FtsZ [Candidatus Nealsonbacteria bacterium CG02_land_8_20_14_3_00_37_10]|uniref:Cell division protein FtsZ n=2 Tax=Candidatus Nealsoniibacteriota TaxID=1817911 RepID=A0A2G9YYT1_9BACT|nr:MAG: cell division protein FtsZ [Candidatus Nealsonbacteria bacterium CG23_combo_of_CG06-09_8_20_14_all_37_18]PIV45170.1 MAG: cell division protein FtsZ [Candidatus Nealsonbacteria bacterium CG02_land_8_20_14_3_00_37_10]
MKNIIKIKVVGVGGSGSNAISRMAKCKIKGIELIAINTDAQDLAKARADVKLRIGRKTTQGLGTGMNPEIGRKSALENRQEISEVLRGSDMVFIACGLGGGTGSGAAPVVAQVSKELGILTLAVVTKPFSFEGQARLRIAENGLRCLKENVDTLISISNDKLLSTLDPNISLINAFWVCDDILRQAVQGISDLILLPGIINVNFADVKTIMANAGSALFGVGRAQGEGRAEKAALSAIGSPLLDISVKGAKGVLFNVSGGKDISLSEIDEVARFITKEVNPEAKIIFGAVQDENLKQGEIKVTVIATGF